MKWFRESSTTCPLVLLRYSQLRSKLKRHQLVLKLWTSPMGRGEEFFREKLNDWTALFTRSVVIKFAPTQSPCLWLCLGVMVWSFPRPCPNNQPNFEGLIGFDSISSQRDSNTLILHTLDRGVVINRYSARHPHLWIGCMIREERRLLLIRRGTCSGIHTLNHAKV